MTLASDLAQSLACPRTKLPLKEVTLGPAEVAALKKIPRTGFQTGDYGTGDGSAFLTAGDGRYYPIAGNFPVVLYPELLVPTGSADSVDLYDPRYHEAYEEMAHYNAIGQSGAAKLDAATLDRLMGRLAETQPAPETFPDLETVWVDSRHDAISQLEAYRYLAPLNGKNYLQLGGSGSHAVKALLAGAGRATLLTPMIGEARQGHALAAHYGVADRFDAVVAIGEELPFVDNTFDAIYSGGCIHHMRTEYAFAELQRVLAPGGRFSSVDPWKTALHGIGTKAFGKRECGVFCRPINPDRLRPIAIFGDHLVRRHGPYLRYPFIVLEKFGVKLPLRAMLALGRFDDGLGRLTGTLNVMGSSIMFAGQKAR